MRQAVRIRRTMMKAHAPIYSGWSDATRKRMKKRRPLQAASIFIYETGY